MGAPWAPWAPMGPHGGPMGPLGGPQGVSPIIPLFPFRVNRCLLTLSAAYCLHPCKVSAALRLIPVS